MSSEGANAHRRQWHNGSSNEENRATQNVCRPTQTQINPPRGSVKELRLVLLGRTGAGKSATGNTILGDKRFDDELSMSSVTKECRRESATVEGRKLALVDTPGFFDTDLTDEDLKRELMHCLALSSPGPHAFLLVIPIERYTEEQQRTVDKILETFHEDVSRHTVLIFSHADKLKGKSIKMFISGQNQKIQHLVEKFGGRFVAFDNINHANRDQVKRLLETVDELLVENENRCFSNELIEVIQEAQRIMEEKVAERMRKIREEVKKMSDDRWRAFMVSLNEERQKTQARKKCVQDKIDMFEANIQQATKTLLSCRVHLRKEQENMRRLQEREVKEEQERMEREEKEKKELEIWTQEEERRRLEEAERKNLLSPNNRKILVMLSMFLLGIGSGYAPMLLAFLFPAAPVVELGLSAQVLAKLLSLGAVGRAGVGVAVPAVLKLATTQCTIQ